MIDLAQDEIIKNWKKDFDVDVPLVSIRCITYNQEKFIGQALDSFLMQKTNFPFEVVVHDDASTDNTANFIREYEKKYPLIIKPIYEKENQWSKSNNALGRIVNAALRGKYIAICEGDDYWIDENKLQMQVDFLENNPEYGMCYTKAKTYNQREQKFSKKTIGASFTDFEDLLVNGNRIPTLTTVYRKDLLDKYQQEIQPNNKGWLMGDYPMWLYFSHESKVNFFDEVTAVYRVLENSASHSVDMEKQLKFERSMDDIRIFFSKIFNVYIELQDEAYVKFYLYVNQMKKKYVLDLAIQMRLEYKRIKRKNLNIYIYNLCSYSVALWNMLWFIKSSFR